MGDPSPGGGGKYVCLQKTKKKTAFGRAAFGMNQQAGKSGKLTAVLLDARLDRTELGGAAWHCMGS